MIRSRSIALAGILASMMAGTGSAPAPLRAQVIRCYDVVCVADAQGVLRCIEKPVPCPPVVT